jgi:hypothetical protein
MKKIVFISLGVIGLAFVAYLAISYVNHAQNSFDPSSIKADTKNPNRTITRDGNNMVNINFKQCTPDREVFWVAFGSTHIMIKGLENDKCIMYLGGEIENPNYDGSTSNRCEIPINSIQSFATTNYGVNFSEITKYCLHDIY